MSYKKKHNVEDMNKYLGKDGPEVMFWYTKEAFNAQLI